MRQVACFDALSVLSKSFYLFIFGSADLHNCISLYLAIKPPQKKNANWLIAFVPIYQVASVVIYLG